ncbi:sodium/calcium exchanger NCL2-like [Mercurialis annua]|uniref:sodium/calcium exchanger NCL2-like n=1 Tax=Mercurialis annua TaxID=3986 RepID=UPI00215FA4E5|nr:sodium/calcium exchanger NCL2-like [Mercurialis annua]
MVANFTLFMLNSVQSGNFIGLNSDKEVMMSRVNYLEINSSILSSKPLNSTQHSCVHYYSFLPCATNIPGFIFQIVILEYLLLVGDKILTKGRQQLFSILGVGIYGATLFRVLAVLPTIVLLLASGLAQNREAARVRIENGAGSLAGSTVFYLTLQWGICIFLGRTKTAQDSLPHQKSKAKTKGCLVVKQKLSILKEYGVRTDKKTKYTAGIMLLSLIPLILAEIASTFKSPPWSHILILVVLCAALISYFIFQSRHQWIQERSLEYSRDQLLLAGFLDHLQKFAKRRLVNDEGKVDVSCIKRTFRNIDKNKDNHVSQEEFQDFLRNMKSGDLELDEEFAIDELMIQFDEDSNRLITEDEFVAGCDKIIRKAKKMIADKNDSSRKYLPRLHNMVQPLIDKKKAKIAEIEQELAQIWNTAHNQQLACLVTDGKPDEDKIRSLFTEFDKDNNKKMTVKELQGLIKSKFGSAKFDHENIVKKMMKVLDIDKDKELHIDEFTDGMKKRLSGDSHLIDDCIEKEKRSIKKMSIRALTKSIVLVIIGVGIVSSLGLPLVNNTQLLSEKIGISSFFISFVLLPFALNFKTAMATIFLASQKKEEASSIIFSEIYGAAFMNNILGLLTLVALIWARGFTWDYSAEVLVILVVSGVIGLIAFSRTIYPFWTSFMAFSFYPLSLLLFYVIRFVVGWK